VKFANSLARTLTTPSDSHCGARTLPMAAPVALLALLAAASGPPISNLSTTAFHSTSINVSPWLLATHRLRGGVGGPARGGGYCRGGRRCGCGGSLGRERGGGLPA